MELVEGEQSGMHPRGGGGGGTTDLGEVAVRRRGALNPHSHLWAVGRVDGDLPCWPTVRDLIDSIL